jgi:hypothetical protein
VGIRSGGKTSRQIESSRKLKAGEVLIMFIKDLTAREIIPLFEQKKESGTSAKE